MSCSPPPATTSVCSATGSRNFYAPCYGYSVAAFATTPCVKRGSEMFFTNDYFALWHYRLSSELSHAVGCSFSPLFALKPPLKKRGTAARPRLPFSLGVFNKRGIGFRTYPRVWK